MEIAVHSLSVSRVHIAMSNLGMSQRMLEISHQARQRPRDLRQADCFPPDDQGQDRRYAEDTSMFCVVTLTTSLATSTKTPHNEYVTEKAAICKLFSIEHRETRL